MKGMVETNYTACATRPEEVVVYTALDAGNYPLQYAERVKSILGNISDDDLKQKVESTLGVFESGADGKLAQSSPYRLVVLQKILPKGKVLVARPRLQIAKENNPDFISSFYVDCGLNLVSSEKGYQVNPVLAEIMAKDLGNIGIDLTNPKLIPINALTYEINGESSSGLAFRLSEEARDSAKNLILNTLDFKWNYLPSKNGLFRAFLSSCGWLACVDDLADSGGNGRVVVETTGEASAKNLAALNNEATALLQRQEKERKDLFARLRA